MSFWGEVGEEERREQREIRGSGRAALYYLVVCLAHFRLWNDKIKEFYCIYVLSRDRGQDCKCD